MRVLVPEDELLASLKDAASSPAAAEPLPAILLLVRTLYFYIALKDGRLVARCRRASLSGAL